MEKMENAPNHLHEAKGKKGENEGNSVTAEGGD